MKTCCKRFLSKLYFIIESYDNFNYSVPPLTTLFMIFNMLGCIFFTFPLVLYKYLIDYQITWLNKNNLLSIIMFYLGAIFCLSAFFAVIMTAHDRRNYKKMKSIVGDDFLNQLEERRLKRPFVMEVVVFILLLISIFVNVFIITYLGLR